MSSSLTHSGAGTGVPSWNFGLAAAAVVIAIGLGFAMRQDDGATVPNVRSAQPMVSDAHRSKAELRAERRIESAWPDQYQSYYQFLLERARREGD